MEIAAVIATRFEPPELPPLLELLRADHVIPVIVKDVGIHPPDWSLYRLWNNGVREAIERGAEYICVMNDDVVMVSGALEWMANVLRYNQNIGVVYPNIRRRTTEGLGPIHLTYTEGT